ncbi:hypothetical protein [Roseibacillus persicicus]|uniref:TonB C-terminal domain-containing protein n=2 Tax=Roseibacillus persicicus TaxID=454148 RepID=A0A918TH92_9BACT|nr:hypothetical protein [Roseibacillus persicicus]MDQ8190344.1 hypothetical protein [Roseibacillus persicicus]GHC46651.1 hypothetical protein GCM10007100_10370 [Roseibacillus persicicus]
MNTYSMRKPRSFDWAKAFLVSVAVHLFLVLLWVGAMVLELFVIEAREFVEEIVPEESIVTLQAEMVEVLQEAQMETTPDLAEVEPKPAEKEFVPTRPSQETSEEVKSERYFGERSTAAASEGEAAESGLEVPTQDGREARTPNDMELANSDFSDGDREGAPGQPGEPLPLSETALIQESIPEPEMAEQSNEFPELAEPLETPPFEAPEPTEPTAQERLEQAQAKAAELLALDESIPVPKEEEKPEPKEETAPEEKIPEPKPAAQSAQMAGGVSGNRGLDGGFDREATKTRLSGTIRRRGESSLEVEDSVKGRFLAEVNREIEKAWQRECILRREHILPGVLAVSFVVNDTGKVTGFRFDSRIAGGTIQEGFTMRAIQKAKIPAMPAEMKEELDGTQLELNLTFFF